MKGCKIFGELLKYGEFWRLGVNEIILIIFYEDVMIGGIEVKRGIYGIMVNVNEKEWEFVIYKNIVFWGVVNYDFEINVVFIKVFIVVYFELLEVLSMIFDKKSDIELYLVVVWDKIMVCFLIIMK